MFFCIGFLSSVRAQCLPNLGESSNFVLFTSNGAIGNTGTSIITGDIGTSIGAITGFGAPSVVNGVIHITNGATTQASTDLTAAYNQLNALTPTVTNHPAAFGTETILPGIYNTGGAGSVGGTLILDGQGNSSAIFVFKIGGALTVGAASTITLVNGALASNVFWLADGAVSMGANTTMSGTIIANGAISMADGGILNGRLLSTSGAIAIYNVVSNTQGIEIADAVGGTVFANQTICSGSAPANLTLSGNTGGVSQWEKASDAAFTSPIIIPSTATILSGTTIGNLTATTYFRAKVQSTNCTEAYSSTIVITMGTITTWNGTDWSNGEPDAFSTAIISDTYTSPGTTTPTDLKACKLTVTNNATVVIKSGDSMTLDGPLTVNTGSFVTFNSNANLLQSGTTNTNSGAIIIKRNSSPLKRLDYTLWSSPVANQQLQTFSPNTLSNRFYGYNTSTNLYQVVDPSTTNFTPLNGHLIRTPNNQSTTTPTIWTGQFTGVPNNGNYSIALQNFATGYRYNLIGNPYPSAIDIDSFIDTNIANGSITGTVYFWRKTNGATIGAYCTYNFGGFVGNNDQVMSIMPVNPDSNTNVVQVGQGFFVEGTGTGNVVFTNDMRINTSVNRFFKTNNSIERNRVWLNITNATGSFSQAMIAYMTGATQGVDPSIDGQLFSDGDLSLASIIGTTSYTIQGRSLPFDMNDVVPISFKVTTAGNYTITIDHVDGLFSNGAQTVYLRDKSTGIDHNLSTGAYTFTSASGTFNTRFEIVYQTALSVTTTTFNETQVVIYKTSTNEISINTGNVVMSKVKIFDVSGRLLQEQKEINATQTLMKAGVSTEILLVQITSVDGVVITKKMLFQRTSLNQDKNLIIKSQLAEDE